MTTTPNMSLVLPTPGGDSGTWDDLLNAAMTLVDGHDHTTGKGPKVPTAGVNINDDLTMAGYALTSIGSADFAETAVASGARRLFFSPSDHELYVRTNGGTNVKITNGASLNLSIVGGIVGDYASVGAEAAYNDSGNRYTWKQEQGGGGVKQWATIASGNVDLYEQLATADATTISNRVRLSSPAALANSYVVTWPSYASLPATPAIVTPLQINGNGELVISSTLTGVTLASPKVSTDQVKTFTAHIAGFDASFWSMTSNGLTSTGSGNAWMPIPLIEGDRVSTMSFAMSGDSAADCTITVNVRSISGTASIGSLVVTNPNGTPTRQTVNVTDTTLAVGESIFVVFAANAANIVVYDGSVTFTHP